VNNIDKLLNLMRRLRDPESGCPWDRDQTLSSIVPHTLEEAYEVADCIERNDLEALPGELGDLLFQVVFYAQIAAERQMFSFDDIVKAIMQKLITRHPHVFGDVEFTDTIELNRAWEAQKASERAAIDGSTGALDGVPTGLPALTRARKLQLRARRVGFDWADAADVKLKVVEELGEVEAAIAEQSESAVAEEIGDLLFATVNWARHLNVDAESALRAASRKFEKRFRYVERSLNDAGVSATDASLEEMDELWEASKHQDATGRGGSSQKKRARKRP
jgi:ATP diphosphatase